MLCWNWSFGSISVTSATSSSALATLTPPYPPPITSTVDMNPPLSLVDTNHLRS
jgi:hypothetical protein